MTRYAVILAGGSGTRLWPASRRARPKQLLPLGPGGETLLGAALRRAKLVADGVMIVTADEQVAATREVLGDAGAGVEIVGEPVGRNTAAAIGLAAAILDGRDPEALLVVMPADQHVADEAGLARAIDTLAAHAAATGAIGTLGITPTRPETGFGWIDLGAEEAGGVRAVRRFVEKPDLATAERYLAGGHHVWNAGWFVAPARRLLAELDAQLPPTAAAVRAIAAGGDASTLYASLRSISIDHAVMEKAAGVACVPADIGWDDIGSWAALPAVRGRDAADNTLAGEALVIDGTGNIVVGDDGGVVAVLGVSDLVIVKAGGAVLVLPKSRAQDVRAIVDALAASGRTHLL